MQQAKPQFRLGQVVATPGALDAFQRTGQSPTIFLQRHAAGDWGDLCDEDRRTNDAALMHGDRLFSSYQVTPALKIWIITELNRSVTTLLLPDEY